MTEECYNQILDLMVLDEIRTDKDRSPDNFFLYKSGSELYEGVIVIDLDLVSVLTCQKPSNKGNFQKWMTRMAYSTSIPTGGLDTPKTYSQRMKDLIEVIDSGRLPQRQVDLIKTSLNYDFPKIIRTSCKSPQLKQYSSKLYEPFSRLWEEGEKYFEHI